MALSILDGNQSATTLSTILTGGAHISAHTVVSLGSQAITDIRSAVSGSVVSISNFPSTQTIAGTVAANNLPLIDYAEAVAEGYVVPVKVLDVNGDNLNLSFGVKTFGTVTVGNSITIGSLPSVLGTVTIGNTVTVNAGSAINWNTIRLSNYSAAGAVALNGIYKKTENVGYVDGAGSGTPIYEPIDGNTWGSSPISFRYAAALTGDYTGNRWSLIADSENIFWASTTASNITSVTGWLNINGAVTATVANFSALPVALTNEIAVSSLPAISGTVTANGGDFTASVNTSAPNKAVQIGFVDNNDSGNIIAAGNDGASILPIKIANIRTSNSDINGTSLPYWLNGDAPINVPISGTVTANSIYPKVTFIDGSGSVVTANSAIQIFATSSTRSYLLVQVTTGSAYVNVGATATTANGIYLGTGQGYAWETTIPQGIVSLISSVTGTAYCAKQA